MKNKHMNLQTIHSLSYGMWMNEEEYGVWEVVEGVSKANEQSVWKEIERTEVA